MVWSPNFSMIIFIMVFISFFMDISVPLILATTAIISSWCWELIFLRTSWAPLSSVEGGVVGVLELIPFQAKILPAEQEIMAVRLRTIKICLLFFIEFPGVC